MSTEISAERRRSGADVSEDAVLGGKLVLRQPLRGHRFGHDSILLAAAVPAHADEHAVDLGAGVGAAGLALARRVAGATVALVEIDPMLAALARDNAGRNGLTERVRSVCLDVASPPAAFSAAGLEPQSADHVLMNPPFNAPDNPSPQRGRRVARAASPETLQRWLRATARLLRPSGTVTLIWRADGLGDVLKALATGFGAVALLPVHPKPGTPAVRILARAVKGRHGAPALLPGLVLADAEGKPTAEAEAILRQGAAVLMAAKQ